jgi:very-short-patch-repair endonuclease
VRRISRNSSEKSASAHLDALISRLAGRQHGVVARRQLHALGVDDDAIAYRVRAGRLHRVHDGVYAVGHTVLTRHGWWMAAVLAAGPEGVLSHAAAAALWELRASAAVIIDVTVPGTGSRKREGLRVHRARDLTGQTTTHERIPVTTPERTILDLAATLQRRPLERLLDQAENARLADVASLAALARAHTGHHGASRLLATLDAHEPGTTLTKSGLEERFLAMCRDAGLPRPRVNAWVEGFEVDFVFAERRLLVETDGWSWHRSRHAFERDRHRDAVHARAGWRTLRFTDRQLTTDPAGVAATVTAAYRGASATSSDA